MFLRFHFYTAISFSSALGCCCCWYVMAGAKRRHSAFENGKKQAEKQFAGERVKRKRIGLLMKTVCFFHSFIFSLSSLFYVSIVQFLYNL